MNAQQIAAAEAALAELKKAHSDRGTIDAHGNFTLRIRCAGPKHCPTAAAIANLEAELAKAKSIEPAMDPRDVADAILRAK